MQVTFTEEVEEFYASSDEERHGPWEEYARDRCRFQRRVQEVEESISYCLSPSFRLNIFQRRYPSSWLTFLFCLFCGYFWLHEREIYIHIGSNSGWGRVTEMQKEGIKTPVLQFHHTSLESYSKEPLFGELFHCGNVIIQLPQHDKEVKNWLIWCPKWSANEKVTFFIKRKVSNAFEMLSSSAGIVC